MSTIKLSQVQRDIMIPRYWRDFHESGLLDHTHSFNPTPWWPNYYYMPTATPAITTTETSDFLIFQQFAVMGNTATAAYCWTYTGVGYSYNGGAYTTAGMSMSSFYNFYMNGVAANFGATFCQFGVYRDAPAGTYQFKHWHADGSNITRIVYYNRTYIAILRS